MPKGKWFFIKSFLNGYVLDISGGNSSAGAKVVTWEQKHHDNNNQLWCYDVATHTIRSKLNNFCLDVKHGQVQMQPHHRGVQTWRMENNKIMERDHPRRVLDIKANNRDKGAELCVYDYNSGDNQHWNSEHIESPYFIIRSRLSPRVLDVKGKNKNAGAEVITWSENKGDNQIWYEDEQGFLRSKLNGYALDSSGPKITLQPHVRNNPDRKWEISGEFIINHAKGGQVLDIRGEKKQDGAELCCYKCHGKDNQRWEFVRV